MLKNHAWLHRFGARSAAIGLASAIAWCVGLAAVLAAQRWMPLLWGVIATPTLASVAAVAVYRRAGHRGWSDAARIGGLTMIALWVEAVVVAFLWFITDGFDSGGIFSLLFWSGVGGALWILWRRRGAHRKAASASGTASQKKPSRRHSTIRWAIAAVGAGLLTLIISWWVLWDEPYANSEPFAWFLGWLPGFGLGLAASGVYAVGGRRSKGDAICISMTATGVLTSVLSALALVGLALEIPLLGAVLAAPFVFVYVAMLVLWVVGIPAILASATVVCGLRLFHKSQSEVVT